MDKESIVFQTLKAIYKASLRDHLLIIKRCGEGAVSQNYELASPLTSYTHGRILNRRS